MQETLVQQLIESGTLKTSEIIEAFRAIDRINFVPEDKKEEAYRNVPLPIGFGQTISQPETVALMLELLQPKKGEKIMDVGAGSGWQSALLAQIVGKTGKIFSIEIVPELKLFGSQNISKYGFIEDGRVESLSLNAETGMQEEAPFDKIISAASANFVPQEWKNQLKVGGRIVMPVKESILLVEKTGENEFKETEYPGFAFVPFIPED
ncbi:protein-L-isoaspartate O-methyltransferase [Patescibacteria group bacterium]